MGIKYKKKIKNTWKILKSPKTKKKIKKALRASDRFFKGMNKEIEETFDVKY